MATLINRSRFRVRVPRKPELERLFPYDAPKLARQYLLELREQGFQGNIDQLDESWLIRIRQKGHKAVNITCASKQEASDTIEKIEGERRRGLFVDYTSGHRTCFAELFLQFADKVCPRHKSCDVERAILLSMVSDLGPQYATRVANLKREYAMAKGKTPRILKPHHTPRARIDWMLKPIAQVKPTEINDYVDERLDSDLAPATIAREIDVISQVVTYATNTLRIELHKSPLVGVTRPSYNNERSRRLSPDEEERLFAAAREEDRLAAREAAIEKALLPSLEIAKSLPNVSARKRYLAPIRRGIVEHLTDPLPTPYFETILTVLLGTAMRRSNALSLEWENVFLEESCGRLIDTKNGHPHNAPLRRHVVEALRQLPRDNSRVFPISLNEFRNAWDRIRQRAELIDYHLHDLRHEALSRLVEASRAAGMPLTVHELAAISGHRDFRCLARYINLCAGELAERMDEAFELAAQRHKTHRGRIRPAIRIGANRMPDALYTEDPSTHQNAESTFGDRTLN
ncbi:MAG: hypothetical protein RLZZ200_3074 [Pseudomonadota bacterium]|jgi:integrase